MQEMEKREIKKLWALMSAYYRQPVMDEVLALYTEHLKDLDFLKTKSAMQTYMHNPKNKFLPLPAQIRDIVQPVVSEKSKAILAASEIIRCISQFGWPDPAGARESMGELAWKVVIMQGGWKFLCQNVGSEEMPVGVAQAQWTKLAEALEENKNLEQSMELIESARRSLLPESVGSILEKSLREQE